MDCERAQDLLAEYLEGTLPDIERAGVNDHLRACLPCRTTQEGLKETIRLLRSLPPTQAPPELLERVRSRIAREEAPSKRLWKKLFLPAHIKIPLEAAAAVVLFLLVYGAQKEDVSKPFPPLPAARMDAAPAAKKGTATAERKAEKAAEPGGPVKVKVRKAPAAPRSFAAPESVSGVQAVTAEDGEPAKAVQGTPDTGRTADARLVAPRAQPSLPVVPLERVSTAGTRIEPGGSSEESGRDTSWPRRFAAPPPVLLASIPNGRAVTIEVAPENRPGLEYRIAQAASNLGGSALGLHVVNGAQRTADIVRCRVPASAAKHFLEELSKLGTVPREEQPASTDLREGTSLEVVTYSVRIRVR